MIPSDVRFLGYRAVQAQGESGPMRIPLLLVLALGLAAGGVFLLSCGEPVSVGTQPAWEYRSDGHYEGPPVDPRGRRPNLVVLILDTLRADCVGGGADGTCDMPFLRALGKRGVQCTQVTSAAPATYPSVTTLLTGLLPDEHRVDHTPYPAVLSPSVTTFAEALAQGHGYETAALLELQLDERPDSLLQGFKTVRCGGPLRFARGQVSGWNKARDREKPFFLLLHSYEAHDPYGESNHPWPPSPASAEGVERARKLYDASEAEFIEHFLLDRDVRVSWLEDDPKDTLRRAFRYYGRGFREAPDLELARRVERAYRDGVRSLDGEVEKTVALLEREGLLENTLLVVTSDHGEAFGEHGILIHGRALHEELVHVPLIAVGPPPFDTGRTIHTSLGVVDILPTFFDLAGLPALQGVAGRSMLAPLRENAPGRAVLSMEELTPFKMGHAADARMVSARTATETYIVTYDLTAGTVIEELFDRATDPGERKDLAVDGRIGAHPVSAELAAAIESARDRIWASVSSGKAHVQMGYGAGVATVSSIRPPHAVIRAP